MEEFWRFFKDVHLPDQLPDDSIPEFVFWGRSNVGKSSLINLLTKKKIAKTSKTPGRTRSLVFFQYKKEFRIVDFPGYGFSKISKKKEEDLDHLINIYLTKRTNYKELFLLIDSRHGIKPIDESISDSLIVKTNKNINIIFTKQDKLKSSERKNQVIHSKKRQIYKKIFHTSINDVNGIIVLKKFLFKSFKE